MKAGDYIHYRYKNYSKFGLKVNKGSDHPDPTGIFNEQRALIINKAKSKYEGNKEGIRAELEKRLNLYFNLKTASGKLQFGWTDAQAANMESKIVQLFEEVLESLGKQELLYSTRRNYSTLSAGSGDNLNLGSNKDFFTSRNKNKIGGEKSPGVSKQFTKLFAVKDRIQELINLRNNLNNDMEVSQVGQDFINGVNAFEKNYKEIISFVNKNAEGIQSNYRISDLGVNFIQDLQKLMDLTRQVTNTAIEGYMGEYIPAITSEIYQKIENDGIEECLSYLEGEHTAFIELIKGQVVGDKTSRKATSKSNFIENTTNRSKYSTDTRLGKTDSHSGYTADKVDVHFELPSGVINASMKNVNLSSRKKINILSGSSTANFIQDYALFTNHYLNVTANIGRPDRPNSNVLMLAHNTFKLTLALHALMGDVVIQEKGASGLSRSESADVLIVNDNAQRGQFKVYFVSDIIQKVADDLTLLNIENFKDPTQYENIWLGPKQNDISAGFARVGKILSQLHVQQLKMSISTSALT